MKKRLFAATSSLAASLALAVGLTAVASAAHLEAPAGLTCDAVEGVVQADWEDVEGATKYSVSVTAGYDTDGDGVVDIEAEYDYGTGDRTDGLPADASNLDIPLSDLEQDVDGDAVADTPIQVDVKVKALDPGKGKGRQDHPFSESCQAVAPAAV